MTAVHVLHVDDEPDIREVVELSLGLDPDFVTRSCDSGHEALAVVAEWPPDIILLDVMMPVMDGPTTLARLRDNPKTASIPVVFMTARAQTRELDLFRSLGAAGVIAKPFDPMTLATSVRQYVPSADPLDSLRSTFLQRVNHDAARLAKHQSALRNKTASPAALAGIRDIAHGLAGAGGIFGFSEISNAASELEEAVIVELAGAATATGTERALDRLLDCVQTNIDHGKRPTSLVDA